MEPLIAPAKRGGYRGHVVVREVVNGLMYILSTGCQWRAIAQDLPPRSTLLRLFRPVGLGRHARSHPRRALCAVPPRRSREASPTAAIIDSQSVKSAEKGGPAIDPTGYDAGKKIKGRKRHILVDAQGSC